VREGFDEDRLSVIHPGVPVKSFAASAAARAGARRELGLAEGEEAVGTTAILDRERGLGDLIDAAAILSRERSSLRLFVIGDGPRRGRLEFRARRSGSEDRIRFLGWREDVARILQALDCWVYAGAGQEVLPLSLIEAMAAGVPVVASDRPGIREIIENGKQGLFVPGRGAEPLAKTILRVLTEKEEGRRIGRAGAVRVQRFHTRAMIEATEALYYRLARAVGED
jgi:glycosyltransferase involved in cell wall biosynthesis